MISILHKHFSAAVAAVLIMVATTANAKPNPHLEFDEGKVWAKDLDAEILYTFARYYNSTEDWKSVFPITTSTSSSEPVDGTYAVTQTEVIFTPRFPFAKGIQYKATFKQEALVKNRNEVYLPQAPTEELRLRFSIEPAPGEAPQVIAVYPTTDVLPENLLRFHITFSASMTRGEAYQRIRLLDHEGNALDRPFLIVDDELWDEDMKSLTIMLDPGRIKRGLRKNIEMGPPLLKDHTYTLEIDSGWKDKDGLMTASTFRKIFRCVVADRKFINVREWTVTAPDNASAPLLIDFHETLDAEMLPSALRIKDGNGQNVEGKFATGANQSGLIFEPYGSWTTGIYTIEINPLLEDLAGNNLRRSFDEDTSVKRKAPLETKLTFKVINVNSH